MEIKECNLEHKDHTGSECVTINKQTQCTLLLSASDRWTIEMFELDPKSVRYYTGLNDYNHFNLFINLLGSAPFDVSYKNNRRNSFFLTLIKLRLDKDGYDLGKLFRICKSSASKVFTKWLSFMYYQFKEIDPWPAEHVVSQHMPEGSKNFFPSTCIVLEATETFIDKTGNVNSQYETFSSYKNRNMLKTMVSIMPMGAISYLLSSYGCSCSDRQIIECSLICCKSASLNVWTP